MKVRCPHCQAVFSPTNRARCPTCHRAVLLPGFFAATAGSRAVAIQEARRRHETRRQAAAAPPMLRRGSRTLVLLLLLAGAGAFLLRGTRRDPPPTATHQAALAADNLQTLATALDILYQHCNRYPSTRQGLAALVHDPKLPGWAGPYILQLKPDPWKHPFRYLAASNPPTLWSAGPDGIDDSPDDIRLATPRN